jgi:pyridoxal phosphate enzyme (YggS family)
MSVKDQLNTILKSIPRQVQLVAVSKTKPVKDIQEAYDAGQRVFGENKIQEMTTKWEVLPKDIQWHMIGHVQRNKVKYMAPYVSLIHGVDSLKLLKEINKQAAKNNRVIPCLLQVHIAREETKFGFDSEELNSLLNSLELASLNNVKIRGLMGMASFTSETEVIENEFKFLKSLFDQHKDSCENFDILSMGMSNDYELAIEKGSNMIRVGSLIFGARFYKK